MFKVNKGYYQIYRVFDLGEEIRLSEVKKNMSLVVNQNQWNVKQSPKQNIIVKNPPLILSLPKTRLMINQKGFESTITAKLYDYGVCSLQFNIPIQDITAKDLMDMQADVEYNSNIDRIAEEKVRDIFIQISSSIKNPMIWGVFEDYNIIFAQEISMTNHTKEVSSDDKKEHNEVFKGDPQVLLDETLAKVLIGEKNVNLSKMMINETLSSTLQYSSSDITVIDWNSAFVYDPQENNDICELIEFVLTHQLEIRYYNQQLEHQKKVLYENIEIQSKNYWGISNFFSKLSTQATQTYLDFSEFIAKVDNSLETVGDVYLAKVIDAADNKFNKKLRNQLEKNLEELKDQSESLSHQLKSAQSNWLSLGILLLIILELKYWDVVGPFIKTGFEWIKSLI